MTMLHERKIQSIVVRQRNAFYFENVFVAQNVFVRIEVHFPLGVSNPAEIIPLDLQCQNGSGCTPIFRMILRLRGHLDCRCKFQPAQRVVAQTLGASESFPTLPPRISFWYKRPGFLEGCAFSDLVEARSRLYRNGFL